MTEKSYTVTDPEQVKSALNLNHTPVGLNIGKKGHTGDSCVIKVIPPTDEVREGIRVNDGLIQDLLEDGAIQPKNDTAEGEITVENKENSQSLNQ